MSISEWDSLAWWEQRIYLDGLRQEAGEDSQESSEEADDEGPSDGLSKLQGYGMNVRVV